MYLPGKLVPENIYDMPFEDFLKLLAMAEIARDKKDAAVKTAHICRI